MFPFLLISKAAGLSRRRCRLQQIKVLQGGGESVDVVAKHFPERLNRAQSRPLLDAQFGGLRATTWTAKDDSTLALKLLRLIV